MPVKVKRINECLFSDTVASTVPADDKLACSTRPQFFQCSFHNGPVPMIKFYFTYGYVYENQVSRSNLTLHVSQLVSSILLLTNLLLNYALHDMLESSRFVLGYCGGSSPLNIILVEMLL